MGIVWEAYHKGVPCPWGSLESPLTFCWGPNDFEQKAIRGDFRQLRVGLGNSFFAVRSQSTPPSLLEE